MAQSKVEICNRAMVILGQAGVLSTGIEGQESRVCELEYDPAVKALLEKGNWTFATRRSKLRRLDETPAFGFLYAYAMPGEWLKTQGVYFDDIEVRDDRLYAVEDDKLLCNQEDKLYMRYTYSLVDPKRFSELFARAVAWGIAVRAAYALVEAGATQQQLLEANEKKAIQEAMSFDSMNQSKTIGFPSPVVSFKY